jgi:hypothetical protein
MTKKDQLEKIKQNRHLAYLAGLEAGNKSMVAGRRVEWNERDVCEAMKVFEAQMTELQRTE